MDSLGKTMAPPRPSRRLLYAIQSFKAVVRESRAK
jgi:hypothetical protein